MTFFRRLGLVLAVGFRFSRVIMQLLRGIWIVYRLPQPCVSIFGGTHVKQTDPIAKQATEIAASLVENNISVLTGGGPGIMQAANCGAYYAQQGELRTLGITVRGLEEDGPNPCAREVSLVLDYFFARKWLLIHYSVGFLIFPGGVGTMDELAELLTLIQTKQRNDAPVILIGTAFWKPFIDWLNLSHQQGLVDADTLKRITVTDDSTFSVELLKKKCLK